MLKEWVLIILIQSAVNANSPVIIDGYQSEELCKKAALGVTKAFNEMSQDSGALIQYRCVENIKAHKVSPRDTSSVQPSKKKEW